MHSLKSPAAVLALAISASLMIAAQPAPPVSTSASTPPASPPATPQQIHVEQPAPQTPPDPNLPKPPAGFVLSTFVHAPDIKSPAGITVSPDGKLFVGEDEYNDQPNREQGLARVKLCVDTNADGKADKFTVFADKLNAPQGLTYVGNTLYVVNAPNLTALRDTNADGIADVRENLVTGLGPVPEGLVHHIPSKIRMGIDGWLYIAIGDKGIVQATGKDGRKISLWGGGTVRVRPDGTMLEVFSHHTRNTFDIAVSPLLDIFTRDNTNDGDGWDSRLAQMQRDAEYGYPRLFKHWGDEIVQPLASYGGGSATGAMWVQDPSWPGTLGNSLYTNDWARGILYRHDLTPKGASFTVTQEEFIKGIRPTDVDMDAVGRMFLADWGRADWGNSGPVGMVYLIRRDPKIAATQPAVPAYPDMTAASQDQLLQYLASPREVWRVNAQCELLKRGSSPSLVAALTSTAMHPGELYVRVTALFTLAQLEGEKAHGTLATLASLPELREFALRALADRDDQIWGVNTDLFVQALKDPDARVRVQAAIGIGHLNKPALAAALPPLTADADPMVRQAAMQSLRRLAAKNVCLAAMKDIAHPDIIAGVMRTLRSFHDPAVVTAVGDFYKSAPTPALRKEAVMALARLYHEEGKWDGSWWTPHPDTRGPYYNPQPWSESPRVADMLVNAAADADADVAKSALTYIGLIEVKEAAPALVRMINAGGPLRDDAAGALIAIKTTTSESLAALEHVALGDNFSDDVRGSAAAALAGIDPAQGQPILLRIITKLDAAPKAPAGLIDKVADALAAHPPASTQTTAMQALLSASKEPVRTAAATSLLRATDAPTRAMVSQTLASNDPVRIAAILDGIAKLPPDNSKPYLNAVRESLKNKDETVRQAGVIALGHLGDAYAIKDLLVLSRRERNEVPIASALAGIDSAHAAADQVQPIAELLVRNAQKISASPDQATYARLIESAQKYLADPRMPKERADALRAKLIEPGVITQYQRTEAIPVPEGPDNAFSAVFPPEQKAAGPFEPFTVKGKPFTWKPVTIADPKGMYKLDMPDSSVVYLSATVTAPAAETALLSAGSDDGLQVWLNGKSVLSKNVDRGLVADMNKMTIFLQPGANVLLFKVDNHGDGSGVQARVRTRVAEFQPDEIINPAHKANTSIARGKELFTHTLACIKCHTIDPHEQRKAPYLGDVGSKFDAKYIVESILQPTAKIAQGFATERILTKPAANAAAGDYVGFITRETADEITIGDATGKITVIKKSDIAKQMQLPGSIMPQGLADNLSLDDFGSLLKFLESMKK